MLFLNKVSIKINFLSSYVLAHQLNIQNNIHSKSSTRKICIAIPTKMFHMH